MLGTLFGAVALNELGCFDALKGFDIQIDPIDLDFELDTIDIGFNTDALFGDELEIKNDK